MPRHTLRPVTDDLATRVNDGARRARAAAAELAVLTRAAKDAALNAMADALQEQAAEILAGNADDVARAEQGGTPAAIVDRLRLTEGRIAGMAEGLRNVARLPDPVGEVVRGYTLPNGLEVSQRRVTPARFRAELRAPRVPTPRSSPCFAKCWRTQASRSTRSNWSRVATTPRSI